MDVGVSEIQLSASRATTASPEQRRQMILQAHGNLVELDKRNEARFGAFLKSLSSELAKAK